MIRKLFIIAVIGTMVLVAGCGKIVPTAPEIDARNTSQSRPELNNTMKKAKEVTVMTRNLYVGTDVDMVIGAQNPNEIPILAAQAFAMLQSTNYAERAEAFVKEIEENQPHLIGLQEVSLIRLQSPGDAIVGGTVPAESVYLSFLKVLLEALIDKGLNYRIAGMVQNADVEIPMIVNPDPTNPAFDDVRLTDFDVVLARHDVAVSNVDEGNFQVILEVPITDPETGQVIWVITIPRGYVAVDATVGDKTYRFVNTHLEPAVLPIREAQAYELTSILTGETNPYPLKLSSKKPIRLFWWVTSILRLPTVQHTINSSTRDTSMHGPRDCRVRRMIRDIPSVTIRISGILRFSTINGTISSSFGMMYSSR